MPVERPDRQRLKKKIINRRKPEPMSSVEKSGSAPLITRLFC